MKTISVTIIVIVLTFSFLSCKNVSQTQIFNSNNFEFPYDVNDPDKSFKLPKELNEISGITFIDKKTIAAVQDEKGTLYLYNIKQKEITEELKFGKGGDFEGIAINKNKITIVSSTGKLYNMQLQNNEIKRVKQSFIEQNSTGNLEGICYDPNTKNYLLAYKGKTAFDDFDERSIYQYPFDKKVNKPIITIGNSAIRTYIEQDSTPSKKLQHLKKQLVFTNPAFYPSAIAIHPVSNDIYLISSINELLIVLDYQTHQIKHIAFLDSDLMPQPEGITFNDDGDLFISTEKNKNKHAYIYQFKL